MFCDGISKSYGLVLTSIAVSEKADFGDRSLHCFSSNFLSTLGFCCWAALGTSVSDGVGGLFSFTFESDSGSPCSSGADATLVILSRLFVAL
jgi:hypothetical protein